jgi:predicted permease
MVLVAAAALLFSIALANALNLMLARAVDEKRDLAVRLALGAHRTTVARDFFAEALVLCTLAAAIGLLIAWWGGAAVTSLHAGLLPRADSINVGASTVGISLGLALLSAAGLSLLVAWRTPNTMAVLRGSSHAKGRPERSRLRDGLVATQVGIAVLLAVGVSLLGRSYLEVMNVDPGFRTDRMLLVNVTSPYSRDQRTEIRVFHERILDELKTLPGVVSAGGASSLPLRGSGTNGTYVELERIDEVRDFDGLTELFKRPERAGYAEYRVVTEDYFESFGIPLLRGRAFGPSDGPEAPHVAIVSRSLADSRWPNDEPIGKLINFGGMDGDLTPFTVVGVVGDIRDYGLDRETRPTFYAYYRQRPAYADSLWFAVRAPAAELAIAGAREAVRRVDPNVPTEFLISEQLYAESIAERRFNFVMLGVFGGAALVLALGGIYAALAFSVAQRSHEIGIRIALGAPVARVIGLVVRRSLAIAGLGIAVGLAVALGASRVAASLLFGIPPSDLISYAVAATLLLLAAVLAALVPALRASRVDPIVTLRDIGAGSPPLPSPVHRRTAARHARGAAAICSDVHQ